MQKIVIGNWKMHKTVTETESYLHQLFHQIHQTSLWVGIAPPFTALEHAANRAKGSWLHIGAQNLHDELQGSFTGEISSRMLTEAGASFVIVGHSERRHRMHESDELIHKKLVRSLSEGLQPVLCIGETALERQAHRVEEVLERQLSTALKTLTPEQASTVWIAYEPVWAIGSGAAASSCDVAKVTHWCRNYLRKLIGVDSLKLLYGGSVTSNNSEVLFKETHIDGVLVGGISLDSNHFAELIQRVERIK